MLANTRETNSNMRMSVACADRVGLVADASFLIKNTKNRFPVLQEGVSLRKWLAQSSNAGSCVK